jgi:hypothetical protein
MRDQFENWIEEYHEGTLPPPQKQPMEDHLQECLNCRQKLALIQWSCQVTRIGAEKAEVIEPSPWFSQKVLFQIARDSSEVLNLWNPFIRVAQRAIPAMAILALILGIFAYKEMKSALSTESDDSLMISFIEPQKTWGEEFYSPDGASFPASNAVPNKTAKNPGGGN